MSWIVALHETDATKAEAHAEGTPLGLGTVLLVYIWNDTGAVTAAVAAWTVLLVWKEIPTELVVAALLEIALVVTCATKATSLRRLSLCEAAL